MSPFILGLGIILVVVAIRGTHNELFELLKGDFIGSGSFVPWLAALTFPVVLGLIPGFKPVARGLLILVILVLFLKRGTGFFDRLNQQLGI